MRSSYFKKLIISSDDIVSNDMYTISGEVLIHFSGEKLNLQKCCDIVFITLSAFIYSPGC